MSRSRIAAGDVIDAAVELIDADGVEQLVIARVAEQLGVQSSALYNHVDGLDGLRNAVTIRSTQNLGATLRDAAVARSGADAVAEVAHAYRRFAIEHPGQYACALTSTNDPDDDLVAAQSAIVDTLTRIVAGLGVTADEKVHASRVLRSAVHGFVALEARDAFPSPQDPNETFDQLIAVVLKGITRDG